MKRTGRLLTLLLMLLQLSCKSATDRWLAGMTEFKEINDKALSLQVMKMHLSSHDTAGFGYQVRIYPSETWLEDRGAGQSVNFFYHMDSCFTVRAGKASVLPAVMQPVSNGIANCYEYLLYFNIEKAIRLKNIELVYKDKFINGKLYTLRLN
jgi:hypothetical protein